MQRYILTLRCPDQPGIVHALAAGVAEAKGNILESAQFSDPGTGIFTIRVSLETPERRHREPAGRTHACGWPVSTRF